jgi:hypothetical protein
MHIGAGYIAKALSGNLSNEGLDLLISDSSILNNESGDGTKVLNSGRRLSKETPRLTLPLALNAVKSGDNLNSNYTSSSNRSLLSLSLADQRIGHIGASLLFNSLSFCCLIKLNLKGYFNF